MRKKGLIGKKLLSVITVLAVCGSVLGGCGSSADTAASGTAPADSAAAETGEAGAFDFASVSDVKFPLKEKTEYDGIRVCNNYRRRYLSG